MENPPGEFLGRRTGFSFLLFFVISRFSVLSRASFNEIRLLNVMGPQGLAWKWCIGSESSFLVIQVGFFSCVGVIPFHVSIAFHPFSSICLASLDSARHLDCFNTFGWARGSLNAMVLSFFLTSVRFVLCRLRRSPPIRKYLTIFVCSNWHHSIDC